LGIASAKLTNSPVASGDSREPGELGALGKHRALQEMGHGSGKLRRVQENLGELWSSLEFPGEHGASFITTKIYLSTGFEPAASQYHVNLIC
jgi:hypothetical protein